MKNLSIVLSVVLSALIGLTFSACNSQNQEAATNSTSTIKNAGSGNVARIVYINTDTLMSQYLLAVELNEKKIVFLLYTMDRKRKYLIEVVRQHLQVI